MDCDKWKEGCYSCDKIKGKLSHFYRDDAKRCYAMMKNDCDEFEELTVVGVSDWLTNRAIQSSIFKNSKCLTVKNGLDTEVFNYKIAYSQEFREVIKGQFKKTMLFVTPNFNHPLKGGEYLIELAKVYKNYRFVIVGYEGDIKPRMDNVLTIAHTSDKLELAKYYANSDLTILLSKRETFSMVLAESL